MRRRVKRVFFGKAGCAACHEVNGRGGIVGPDLSGAGRLSPAALRQAIVDPNSGPAAATVVVRTRDGREIRGVRRNEDTFSVQMVDAAGRLHLLDKQTLASFQVERRSLMPADYATRLSAAEITDLVAYLRTLQGRDLRKTIGAADRGRRHRPTACATRTPSRRTG